MSQKHQEQIDAFMSKVRAMNPSEPEFLQAVHEVAEAIIPFMENMMQDPEKVMIRWPNRAEVVEKQLKKILSIIEE